MQSINDLIPDYLTALRILDLEGASALGHEATRTYRRHLLQRVAKLDEQSSKTAPKTTDTDK